MPQETDAFTFQPPTQLHGTTKSSKLGESMKIFLFISVEENWSI